MGSRIILSVDPNYALAAGDAAFHVWIIRSPANLSLAEAIRKTSGTKSMTVFADLGSRVESAISMLATVFEHHPEAVEATLRGLTEKERQRLINEMSREWVAIIIDEEIYLRRRS